MGLSIFYKISDGVMTVMYLFVRQKFHWSVREFTFFETVGQLVPMLGAIIGFLILRKVSIYFWYIFLAFRDLFNSMYHVFVGISPLGGHTGSAFATLGSFK